MGTCKRQPEKKKTKKLTGLDRLYGIRMGEGAGWQMVGVRKRRKRGHWGVSKVSDLNSWEGEVIQK